MDEHDLQTLTVIAPHDTQFIALISRYGVTSEGDSEQGFMADSTTEPYSD